MLAVGRIGDEWSKRCTVPIQGQGSPNVFSTNLAIGRLGDQTNPYQEIVPCPDCCETFVSSVISGSPKVFINGVSTLRIGDLAQGISGPFPLQKGAPTVFIS